MRNNNNFILFFFLTLVINSLFAQDKFQDDFIHYLSTIEEARTSRLWVLENAKEEILISYYIFEDDAFGMLFLQKLIQIKKDNPQIGIKILIDASANGLSKNIMYHLNESGLQIKEYHPLPKLGVPYRHTNIQSFFKALRNINIRMHDKLLIVDRKMIISGGRNVEKSYFGLDNKNFHDRDVLIYSKSLAKKVVSYYTILWNSSHVQALCPAIDYSKNKDFNRDIARFDGIKTYIEEHPDYKKMSEVKIDFIKSGIPIDSVDFLHSYSPEVNDFRPLNLSLTLYNMALKVEREMIIETPYLLYTKRFYQLLKILRKKNVKITFITNSFCSTDVMAAAAAYDIRKRKLLKIGCEIYEYKLEDYLHAKSAVFDNKLAFIGSFNMDPRSAYINTETVFVIAGKKAVENMRKAISKDQANSVKLYLEKGKVRGGFNNCDKTLFDMLLYTTFKPLSKISWIYALL